MVKVIIADSNFIVRAGLRSVLSQSDDFAIVSEVKSNEELGESLTVFDVDVVLMDYTSEGFSLDSVLRWSKKMPLLKWVAITGDQTGTIMVGALRAGFLSYIKKDCDFHEIVDAVKETSLGARFFCGKVLAQIRKENIQVDDLNIIQAECEGVVISERE
jgi:DNA-binding NarL/FixJ family response regulator